MPSHQEPLKPMKFRRHHYETRSYNTVFLLSEAASLGNAWQVKLSWNALRLSIDWIIRTSLRETYLDSMLKILSHDEGGKGIMYPDLRMLVPTHFSRKDRYFRGDALLIYI